MDFRNFFGISQKPSKTAIGGGLTCITLGIQLGYISVDWDKVKRDYNYVRRHKSTLDLSRVPGKELLKENAPAMGGFGGGFLLALGQ